MAIDIDPFPRFRDRRSVTREEWRSTKGGHIFGEGTWPRRRAETAPGRFMLPREARGRDPASIHLVILHITSGPSDRPGGEDPPESTEVHDAYIDGINCHFLVMNSGVVYYLRDCCYTLNNRGGRFGIDIEFAGCYGLKNRETPTRLNPYEPAIDPVESLERLSDGAIQSARLLLRHLKRAIGSIGYLHPHGQFTALKRDTCCGPDVWMNVGEPAAEELSLETDRTFRPFVRGDTTNLGISDQQRNQRYKREV